MPGRNITNEDYRFGFNGKFEKIDDISVVGGHIDWAGYVYDTRLARRWSMDKLKAKYPWQSPYSAIGNNPILNQELDGKDYAVYVNHKTKTITIKATYYTLKDKPNDFASAVKATEYWNDQSGKFQYKVGKGKTAELYDINFKLEVVPATDPQRQATNDGKPASRLDDGEVSLIEDGSSNSYELSSGGGIFRGKAAAGMYIMVSEKRKREMTGAHEVGHTLGLSHKLKGLMVDGTKPMNRKFKKSFLKVMFRNAGIGKPFRYHSTKVNSDAQATTFEEGKNTKDFNKGKVKKIKTK